jgi:predicted nucleic acid-binding Zn ribbon protein
MSHNRYMSWPDAHALTMAPNYPPAGATNEYPSPAASRRPSECFSEMSMSSSRRGSLAGFASDMESTGQWQSIGSESKSPLAQFGFFKSLTEKKTTRGLLIVESLSLRTTDKYQMVKRRRGEARSQTASQP